MLDKKKKKKQTTVKYFSYFPSKKVWHFIQMAFETNGIKRQSCFPGKIRGKNHLFVGYWTCPESVRSWVLQGMSDKRSHTFPKLAFWSAPTISTTNQRMICVFMRRGYLEDPIPVSLRGPDTHGRFLYHFCKRTYLFYFPVCNQVTSENWSTL